MFRTPLSHWTGAAAWTRSTEGCPDAAHASERSGPERAERCRPVINARKSLMNALRPSMPSAASMSWWNAVRNRVRYSSASMVPLPALVGGGEEDVRDLDQCPSGQPGHRGMLCVHGLRRCRCCAGSASAEWRRTLCLAQREPPEAPPVTPPSPAETAERQCKTAKRPPPATGCACGSPVQRLARGRDRLRCLAGASAVIAAAGFDLGLFGLGCLSAARAHGGRASSTTLSNTGVRKGVRLWCAQCTGAIGGAG